MTGAFKPVHGKDIEFRLLLQVSRSGDGEWTRFIASLHRSGKLDEVLHDMGIAHGVYADGFLQGDAHEQLFDGYFQLFPVEGARHFGYGDDLIGYVMRREACSYPGADAGFKRII